MTSPWPDGCTAVAAYGLGQTSTSPPPEPLPAPAWHLAFERLRYERITGLLDAAVADGAFPVTDEQAAAVSDAHRAAMAAAVLLERTLDGVATLLADAGVDRRVLKGPAVAHLDYPDPSLRSFGDIDLLVRPEQFDAAVGCLVAAGHTRKFPEPRPGFDRRFGKGSCLVGTDGYEIDLHRTLAMGPYGMTVRVDDLWATAEPFVLAGREHLALGPDERFLHACFHAALGDAVPRLSALRDIAQMRLGGTIDVEKVRHEAAAWRAEAVVARAIEQAWSALELPPDELSEWARRFRPSADERRAIAVYADLGQTYAAKSFAAVRAIPTWGDRARYVFTLAFPRREYLRARQEGRLHRWRRGVAQVVRSRRS